MEVMYISALNVVKTMDIDEEMISVYIDGMMEIVPYFVDPSVLIVLDEEGKLKQKPLNLIATALYGNINDYIVGDVIICGTKGENFVSLTKEQMMDIAKSIAIITMIM